MNHSTQTIASLILTVLTAATLAACGNSGGTTTGTGGAGTGGTTTTGTGGTATTGTGGADAQMAKWCDDIEAPYCEALFACCTDPTRLMQDGGSVAACKTKFATSCQTDFGAWFLPHLQAGEAALNEGALAACVASLGAMKSGGAACTRPPSFVLEIDCVAAFKGKIAAGAACDSSNLPDSGYIICAGGNCNAGKCEAFKATGATCDPSQDNSSAAGCNYPAREHCVGTGTTGACGPVGKVGDACANPDGDKTFDCYSMSCGPAGTCIAPTDYGICSQG